VRSVATLRSPQFGQMKIGIVLRVGEPPRLAACTSGLAIRG